MDTRITIKYFSVIMCILALSGGFSANAQSATSRLDIVAEDVVKALNASETAKVAVLDLTNIRGNRTALGRFLAEELAAAIASTQHSFDLIDRVSIQSLLQEHALSLSGITKPENARELGRISGVSALIVGSYTPFGESYRVLVKILDTESARRLGSASINIPKTSALRDLSEIAIDSPLDRGGSDQTASAKVNSAVTGSTNTAYDFDTGQVRGALQSLSSKDKMASMTLSIENYQEKPLWLFILDKNNHPSSVIAGQQGGTCRAKSASGVGYSSSYESPGEGRDRVWTLVSPGQVIYTTFTYECNPALNTGGTATAVTEFGLTTEEKKPSRISVGIPSIKLPE